MKSVTLVLSFLLLSFASVGLSEELEPLFNGKDLKGLQTTGNWTVNDGVLHLVPREGEKGWKRYGAYLWSEKEYEDFEAELEFKYPPKGNSGFYFRSAKADPVKDGIEVQILDSFGVEKKLGHHDMGGIIRTAGPAKNASKPAGEWNKLWVKAVGSKIQVKLNGELIQDIDLAETASKDKPKKGFLSVQDHGLEFWVKSFSARAL